MEKIKILMVCGTRPEAIKLAPLWWRMKEDPQVEIRLCSTGQHREMLNQVLDFFKITPVYNLDVMLRDQTLFGLTARIMDSIAPVFDSYKPHWVVVQGDTTSAFAGALGAFYADSRVAHVEAGLRTYNKRAPFPEEMNRSLVGRLADLHFAPTWIGAEQLEREGIPREHIHIVGNTVVDALNMALEKVKENSAAYEADFKRLNVVLEEKRKLILVTGHRRENFGTGFSQICEALKTLANEEKVTLVYPVHLNPNVKEPVHQILGKLDNVHLIEPVDYPHLVWLMHKSYLILTDSGGIQEEAPTLGKPVLVMREVTERPEGINAGAALLVGTDKDRILEETKTLLKKSDKYASMSKTQNPYGDGKTSERIVKTIKETHGPVL